MTEKRFKLSLERDLKELERYCDVVPPITDGGVPCTQEYVCRLLNEQNDEIILFKTTILESYENERTALGRSVLKQLAENLGLI